MVAASWESIRNKRSPTVLPAGRRASAGSRNIPERSSIERRGGCFRRGTISTVSVQRGDGRLAGGGARAGREERLTIPAPADRFDAVSVREAWDRAADTYTRGQAEGRDFYRYEFFGPAHLALCGDVRGRQTLDVGCGNGYLTRELARRGALVTGIDISPRMIAHARDLEASETLEIAYRILDAATLPADFAPGSFDLIAACLSLQDMPHVDRVLRGCHALLRPNGRLVASITHPCTDTPFREWEKGLDGAKRWLCIDRYFDRGPLAYLWRGWGAEFTTEAHHATLEDWMGWILDAGFQVRALKEPRPTEEAVRARPDLADAARVPYYLFFDLVRPPDRG